MIVRAVQAADRKAYAAMVRRWGYQRPIPDAELEVSEWFRFHDGDAPDVPVAVFWFTESWTERGTALSLHFYPGPALAGRHFAEAEHHAVYALAQILGADEIHAVYCPMPVVPVAALKRYLRRWGWEAAPFGMRLRFA